MKNTPRIHQLNRLAERETVIQYDDADDDAKVFTCHRGLARHLMKRGVNPIRVGRRGGKACSWWFSVPKSWVAVRPPRRVWKSPEQKRAELERLALLRKAPLSGGDPSEVVSTDG